MTEQPVIAENINTFLFSLDSEKSGRNRANLAYELGLHDPLSTSIEEDEVNIQYRISEFKIGEIPFQVNFNNPGTCEIAVLLMKLCDLYGGDCFMLDSKCLLVIRTYFGSRTFKRVIEDEERKIYDKPLHILLTSGEQMVTITRT